MLPSRQPCKLPRQRSGGKHCRSAPVPSQKRPRGQGMQALPLERRRGGQGAQEVALGADMSGKQEVQEVTGPELEEKEPDGQRAQA